MICFRIISVRSKSLNSNMFYPHILGGRYLNKRKAHCWELSRITFASFSTCSSMSVSMNVSIQYIQLLLYIFCFLGFFFFVFYPIVLCLYTCPVLLGNEWKHCAKVWTISSWILKCGNLSWVVRYGMINKFFPLIYVGKVGGTSNGFMIAQSL